MKHFLSFKALGVSLLLMANVAIVEADTVSVSGQILGADGKGLYGATVSEKGSANGAIADENGNYTISVDSSSTLVYQNIGFVSQEMSVGSRTSITVKMSEDVNELDEVIVMAYGTKKKRDVIGSVAKVNTEDLKTVAGGNFQNALQGRAAGVSVVGGALGGDPQIKIRGVSSISSGTDPLWVVDGVIGSADVPMADIASIEILKDASATAIYGSRGSNGVIIVTTKQAESGELKVTANYEFGVTSITNSDIGQANTAEYFEFLDAAHANAGVAPFDPYNDVMTDWEFVETTDFSREDAMANDTDYLGALTRTGQYHDAYVSISGGSGNLSNLVSLNYRDENMVYEGYDKNKFRARVNSTFKKGDVKIGFEAKGSFSNSSDLSQWGSVVSEYPWKPFFDEDSDTGYWNIKNGNALAKLNSDYRQNEAKSMGGSVFGYAEYTPSYLKGLSLRVDTKINGSVSETYKWASKVLNDPADGNTGTRTKQSGNGLQSHLLLSYNKKINEDHSISALAGLEYRRSTNDHLSLSGRNIIGEFQELASITDGDFISSDCYGILNSESYLFNYLTRFDYKYKDRYLVGASFVREGSSRFTADNRWGNFWSVSAGWIISDESFMSSTSNWLSQLKLRGSYGVTGNQNIAADATLKIYSSQSNKTYNWETTNFMTTLPNKDVTWEKTGSVDVGLDFGFFDNRLSGSVAYYRQNVDDMLTNSKLPASAGVPTPGLGTSNKMWANIGSMYNHGVEVDLTYRAVTKNNFAWSVSANLATNHNEVTALDPQVDINHTGIISMRPGTITRKGDAIGTYYMAEWAGVNPEYGYGMIYEIDQDIFEETGETVKTGNTIPATQQNMLNNRIVHDGKTGLPTIYGGLVTDMQYKNFDFSLSLSYSMGSYIFNEHGAYSYNDKNIYDDWYANSWKKPGDIAKYPQAMYKSTYDVDGEQVSMGWSAGAGFHDQALEKADYLKLQNITIGYTLPERVLKSMKIDNMRFYVSGSNLLTITGFNGYDPEIELATTGGVKTNGIQFRRDSSAAPRIMTVVAGVNLKF